MGTHVFCTLIFVILVIVCLLTASTIGWATHLLKQDEA